MKTQEDMCALFDFLDKLTQGEETENVEYYALLRDLCDYRPYMLTEQFVEAFEKEVELAVMVEYNCPEKK